MSLLWYQLLTCLEYFSTQCSQGFQTAFLVSELIKLIMVTWIADGTEVPLNAER